MCRISRLLPLYTGCVLEILEGPLFCLFEGEKPVDHHGWLIFVNMLKY